MKRLYKITKIHNNKNEKYLNYNYKFEYFNNQLKQWREVINWDTKDILIKILKEKGNIILNTEIEIKRTYFGALNYELQC